MRFPMSRLDSIVIVASLPVEIQTHRIPDGRGGVVGGGWWWGCHIITKMDHIFPLNINM